MLNLFSKINTQEITQIMIGIQQLLVCLSPSSKGMARNPTKNSFMVIIFLNIFNSKCYTYVGT